MEKKMRSTFDDFEKKVKSLNEDEIGFPINLGDAQAMAVQMGAPQDIETVEIKEIKPEPEKHEEKHEHCEENNQCPFKKAMEMMDFAKAGILKLKEVPKPEITPGQPFDENCEYNKIRRSINAALDFVRQII
jgi:hypothetical protein